jgi:gas vesicle protein
MKHNSSGFVKGIAIGIVAGATVGLVAAPHSRDAKRTAGRFLRAAGEVVENISSVF